MCVQEIKREQGAFDVAAAIANFVKDGSLASLELPGSLTADQRKQAKRLADQHPCLRCESFGFGADRRLHLFKQVATTAGADARLAEVRVKNTFIDGFFPAGGEGDAEQMEAVHFRSVPNGLSCRRMFDGPAKEDPRLDDPAAAARAPPQPIGSSRSSSKSSTVGSAQCGPPPGLPGLPEGFRFTVRDTFIHIEAPAEPATERTTQSMPNGMFAHHLEEELLERRRLAAAAARLPPPPPTPVSISAAAPLAAAASLKAAAALLAMPSAPAPRLAAVFAEGTRVTIDGLVKCPAFNGLTGTVTSFDDDTGRYNVLLDDAIATGGNQWAKVKAENLQALLPPPPFHAPTILVDADYDLAHEIPPTPTWECSGEGAGGMAATALKLDALV